MMKLKSIVILLIIAVAASAQTNTQIKNLESQRKKAMKDIEVTTKLLNQTSDSKKITLGSLTLLSQQIQLRKNVINTLGNEIEDINEEIKAIENEIKALEANLEYKKSNYAKSLQHMSLLKNTQDKLLFIFAADGFTQSYRRMRYLKEYADWQKKQGVEISAKQAELKVKNETLAASKNDKLVLVQEKEKEENNLKKEEALKQKEIKTLTAKEKELKKELDKKNKQATELDRQIKKAIEAEIAKVEAERIKKAKVEAEKAKKTNEIKEAPKTETASSGLLTTKEDRQLSANFESNKGKLPFPLKGQYKIVNRFGQNRPEGLKYVTLNSNGIDIQTTANNEAKSVFNGEVSKVFVVPGYNNSVIVRHGNYLTIYCNLSEVYVKANEKVKTGQTLGKIFTDSKDGNSTILHFELWKEKTKQNPESWLNR